ncbi:LLM class flavin-dependent oxidoreductase [Nesterenkonia suensis]
MAPRIGFFSRLLEDDDAASRYQYALEQIQHAERLGFHSAWVAQHHFSADEGGLPSPWPLLGAAAATTSRIRLGTAVVTLPHENPIRTAEDAAVVDVLSDGRFEFGVAPGASPDSLEAFGHGDADAREIFTETFSRMRAALRGEPLGAAGFTLQPLPEGLDTRIWQATFSARGATRAGQAGDGVMLSRIQPGSTPGDLLSDQQNPLVDAYLANLPADAAPRILASRTLVVVDEQDRDRAARRARERVGALARRNLRIDPATLSDAELYEYTHTYFGTVEEVVERLAGDEVVARSTDVSVQVHSVDPGHELTLRSLELIATEVAPALGWQLADEH